MTKRALLMGASLWLMGGCATMAEVDELRTRVARLEIRLNENEAQSAKAQAEAERAAKDTRATREAMAALGVRQDEFSERLQIVEGGSEDIRSRAGQVHVATTRLNRLESEQAALRDQLAELQGRLAATSPTESAGGKALYERALAAYEEGEFDEARAGFRELLEIRPPSPFAGHAEYWLGEAQFGNERYGEALQHYTRVIRDHPESAKRCAALLKAGMAWVKIDNEANARVFFNQVQQDCKDTPEAEEAEKLLQR
jgi:tol-pal system protein YbgF